MDLSCCKLVNAAKLFRTVLKLARTYRERKPERCQQVIRYTELIKDWSRLPISSNTTNYTLITLHVIITPRSLSVLKFDDIFYQEYIYLYREDSDWSGSCWLIFSKRARAGHDYIIIRLGVIHEEINTLWLLANCCGTWCYKKIINFWVISETLLLMLFSYNVVSPRLFLFLLLRCWRSRQALTWANGVTIRSSPWLQESGHRKWVSSLVHRQRLSYNDLEEEVVMFLLCGAHMSEMLHAMLPPQKNHIIKSNKKYI